jgi:hypothetical protein
MGGTAVLAAALLVYGIVERHLRQTPISGATVFTAVGLLTSEQVTVCSARPHSSGLTITLDDGALPSGQPTHDVLDDL